jgi:D-lactate dehydrogenase (cytochrome)
MDHHAGTSTLPKPEVGVVIEALRARFGDRCSTSETVRRQHAHTVTWLETQPADVVVFPESTDEVAAIVRLCASYRVPVIPFGTGTSLEGHVNAPLGGVTVVLRGMKRIVAVHADDLDVTVEAGVTRKELNTHLRDTGLFFPIDPGADASIGGMVATRASGTNAVRYGTMKDNVLALTVVLPNGEVVKTGGRARKSSAGYDLTRLLVGAEGTLGVITEVTLKLQGIPEAVSGGICPFPTVAAACEAVFRFVRPTPIPSYRCRRCQRCSWSFTARRRVWPRRPIASAPSRRSSAAGPSSGPAMPRNAAGCGRRGTMPIGHRSR